MFKERVETTPTVKAMTGEFPYLIIDEEALFEMQLYVQECKDEIGWLGSIEELEGRGYLLTNVFLFDQEVHATTTEITPEGLEDFAMDILQYENGVDLWNSMRLWGHSHVNMPINPSGQDDSQMEEFAKNGHPYFFRLIANKQGELKVDMYDYDAGVEYHNIPWASRKSADQRKIEEEIKELQAKIDELREGKLESIKSSVQEEMKQKVRKKSYVTTGKYVGGKQITYIQPQVEYKTDVFDYSWSDVDIMNTFAEKEIREFKTSSYEEIEEVLISFGYSSGIDYDFEDLKAIKRFAEKYNDEMSWEDYYNGTYGY